MDVINCKGCGRLFNALTRVRLCPNCQAKLEEKFQEVKKFIQQNRRASMQMVCEECDVEPGQIQAWIRQERLQFAEDSPIKVSCEKCGCMISSGRYCDKCKNDMSRDLGNMMRKPVEELKKEPMRKSGDNKNRMRFL